MSNSSQGPSDASSEYWESQSFFTPQELDLFGQTKSIDPSVAQNYLAEHRLSSDPELHGLLRMADHLQETLDHAAYRIQRYKLYQLFSIFCVLLTVGFAVVFYFAYPNFSLSLDVILLFSSCAVAYVAFFLIYIQRMINRITRVTRRDARAMNRVVTLLHEYHDVILTKNNDWSPLRRAEFEIRLSRYDFGPHSDLGILR